MTAHHPLTPIDLFPAGVHRRLGSAVHTFPELDSTNRWLIEHARELPDGAIAVTEFQTAGRGRLGRQWLAPRGSSLLMSVFLIEPVESPLISLVGLAMANAACTAIENVTDVSPGVRWPNDLVVEDRKLGGVLVETAAIDAQRRCVVIGMGLNCLQQAGHFPNDLTRAATSLEIESSQAIGRAAVAARVLSELDQRVAGFDPAVTLSEWRSRCIDIGRSTELLQAGQHYAGTVVDVAENADLVVQLATGGRRSFEAATTTRQI